MPHGATLEYLVAGEGDPDHGLRARPRRRHRRHPPTGQWGRRPQGLLPVPRPRPIRPAGRRDQLRRPRRRPAGGRRRVRRGPRAWGEPRRRAPCAGCLRRRRTGSSGWSSSCRPYSTRRGRRPRWHGPRPCWRRWTPTTRRPRRRLLSADIPAALRDRPAAWRYVRERLDGLLRDGLAPELAELPAADRTARPPRARGGDGTGPGDRLSG